MNVAGMTLGIIAVAFAFIPVFGAFVSFPCALIGLPLSAISFVRKNRQREGTGMAVAGLVTNIAGLLIVIAWTAFIGLGIAFVEDSP